MSGVIKRKTYTHTGEASGIRGDAVVEESDNGSVRISLTLNDDVTGKVTLHHTMWEQIVRDFPGSAAVEVREMMKSPRYTVGDLHGTRVVWEMNELIDGRPDPRPLSLDRIAEMLNERNR